MLAPPRQGGSAILRAPTAAVEGFPLYRRSLKDIADVRISIAAAACDQRLHDIGEREHVGSEFGGSEFDFVADDPLEVAVR